MKNVKKLINMAKPTLERSLVVGKDYASESFRRRN